MRSLMAEEYIYFMKREALKKPNGPVELLSLLTFTPIALHDKEVKDKLEGMKYLLAMMTKGRNMSSFMPDVVKNVIAKSVEVKKLVYMYLVHYADFSEEARELALLSINSFQKDMHATNQLR